MKNLTTRLTGLVVALSFLLSGLSAHAGIPTVKEVYHAIEKLTADGKPLNDLIGQVVEFDWTNPTLVNFQNNLESRAVDAANAVKASGGSLADVQTEFMRSITQDLQQSLSVGGMDTYKLGLSASEVFGQSYGSVTQMLAKNSTGIMCSEASVFAQKAIENQGAQFFLNGGTGMFQIPAGAFPGIIQDELHTAVWVFSTNPSGMGGGNLNLYNPNWGTTDPEILTAEEVSFYKIVQRADVTYAIINKSGQLTDTAGNVIKSIAGEPWTDSLIDAVDSASAKAAAIAAGDSGTIVASAGLDFANSAGSVELADAEAALTAAIPAKSLGLAVADGDAFLFSHSALDWLGGAADVLKAGNDVLLVAQALEATIYLMNRDATLNGNKPVSYSDVQGMCNMLPSCANSDAATQLAYAVNILTTQPEVAEISGSVPNMLYNPQNPAAGVPEALVQFNTLNPTGFAPCNSSATKCFGEPGGISLSQMPDGTFLENNGKATLTYTQVGIVPYDFKDGNGIANYPVYQLSLTSGGNTVDAGYVSAPGGRFNAGSVVEYAADVSHINSTNAWVFDPIGDSVTVTASELPLDTISTPETELIESVDMPTYDATVGAPGTFDWSDPVSDLGVDPSVNKSPLANPSYVESGTNVQTQEQWYCQTTGSCTNTDGTSYVMSSPTYYASNGGFSYTSVGVQCVLNYMSGCYNNNPAGGFGGAGQLGGTTNLNGGGAGEGGYYNPCGIDGEFDPQCWSW